MDRLNPLFPKGLSLPASHNVSQSCLTRFFGFDARGQKGELLLRFYRNSLKGIEGRTIAMIFMVLNP